MSDIPTQPDSAIFDQDVMERAMALLDSDTQEILRRERAGLELSTAMAALALGETLSLSDDTVSTFTQSILDRARALPPDHHRHANVLLARLRDSVLLPSDDTVTAPVVVARPTREQEFVEEATKPANDQPSVLAEEPLDAADQRLADGMPSHNGDEPVMVEAPEQPEQAAAPKPTLLERLLERTPEVTARQASNTTNGNGTSKVTENAPEVPTDAPEACLEDAAVEAAVDELVLEPARPEQVPPRDLVSELKLKVHFRVPRNMSSFIRNVMPQSFAERISKLDPEAASLISFMLTTDYLTSDAIKVRQDAKERNALIASKYLGVYELDKDFGSVARALNTNSSDVRKRVEATENALKTQAKRERLVTIFEAGENHLLVEDMIPSASEEEALTAKK